jgi:hypothetical protein
MKNLEIMLLGASLVLLSLPLAFATETLPEKVAVAGNNTKRALKKGGHRVEEAFCAKGDISCAGDKVKNRTIEATDASVDKLKEIKNKVN